MTLNEIENKYGVKIKGVTLGSNPVSEEAVLKEIDRTLQNIVDGDFEEVEL